MSHSSRSLFFKLAACLLLGIVATTYLAETVNCHGHDHHGHTHDEPAHFKYSKQANQKQPDHGHAHDHHGHAHDHHGHAHEQHEQKKATKVEPVKRDQLTIVMNACLSTLLISLAPFVILFFIPLNNNGIENQSLLKVLLGFASGSLLGKIASYRNFLTIQNVLFL